MNQFVAVTVSRHELRMMLLKRIRDVLEEDEPKDDMLVLGRVHVVAKFVGCQPKLGLEAEVRGGVVFTRGGFFDHEAQPITKNGGRWGGLSRDEGIRGFT